MSQNYQQPTYPPYPPSYMQPMSQARPVNKSMKSLSITFFVLAFACGLLASSLGYVLLLAAATFQVVAFICLCLI